MNAPDVPSVSRSITDRWPSSVAPAPAVGFTAGAWQIFPQVTAGAFYDDNVFATNSNRQSDWGYLVRPEIGARTQGSNYVFTTQGFVEDRQYTRFKSEDQVNGAVGAATVVQPDNDTQVVGRLRYVHGHEDRGTGESVFGTFDKPVAYDTLEAAGAFNKRYNRVWTSVGVAELWSHYQNPTIGGVPVDFGYRDGNVTWVNGRAGYVVAPLTSVFVEVAGNDRHWQVSAFDSDGYRVVGGVLLEPGQGARLIGEAYAGYMYQTYNGSTFQTVSTFTYGGLMQWLIAPQWTAVFVGRRDALESAGLTTTAPITSGVSLIESLVGARLDYAIQPNFIVGAGASYLVDEFVGAGRTDRILSPLVSVKYLPTRNITLGFDYRNVSFGSSGLGVLAYYRNVYLFSINAKF
ncbi:MAG TPA: outer membrane beta-barrel protein [Pseudolabrys sp.]|nr:outer membrane beta-barrel protein [Pseudolabrys sp.]